MKIGENNPSQLAQSNTGREFNVESMEKEILEWRQKYGEVSEQLERCQQERKFFETKFEELEKIALALEEEKKSVRRVSMTLQLEEFGHSLHEP